MKRAKIFIAGFFALVLIYQACSVVPLTGRKQLNLLPESEMISMSLTSYTDFLKENPVSADQVNQRL